MAHLSYLADVSAQNFSLYGAANAYLSEDPNYYTLHLRLELADTAVEAAMVEPFVGKMGHWLAKFPSSSHPGCGAREGRGEVPDEGT